MKRRIGFFVIPFTGWLCCGAFHEAVARRDRKGLVPETLKELKEEYMRQPTFREAPPSEPAIAVIGSALLLALPSGMPPGRCCRI